MQFRRYGPLLSRFGAIAAILLAEILLRGILLEDAAEHVDYFPLQPQLYRLVLAWAGALAILTAMEGSRTLAPIAASLAGRRLRLGWLVAHIVLMTFTAFPGTLNRMVGGDLPVVLQQVLQHLLFATAVLSLLLAVVPAFLWRELLGSSGRRALVALLLAGIAVLVIQPVSELWESTAALTFRVVGLMIGPFYPDLQLVPESLSIITDTIEIHISESCSGLEGMAFMLVLCGGWLWYLRSEFRFPRALLLLPAATLFMFLLNSLRIAILAALAAQGHVAVATVGFHSQAGWIFFIAAAFLVALLSRRIGWLRRAANAGEELPAPGVDSNATAAYVLPLVGVLAAGMLTRAMSAGFDPLQWLRLPIAAALLLLYRDSYATLDWRFSWRGIAAGIAVFGVWVLAAHWLATPAGMPEALSQQPPLQRDWWITTRAMIAVLVVPVVEELAFRGFLMRRLQAADFSALPMRAAGLRALLLSSMLFGLSHGSYWLPGIFAGLVFGGVARRTGRIGEAVAAHAVANGLLTLLVLAFGQWQHW